MFNIYHSLSLLVLLMMSLKELILCHQDKAFPQFQEADHLFLCLEKPLLHLFADFYMVAI